jgi:monothiol glutaredoxin
MSIKINEMSVFELNALKAEEKDLLLLDVRTKEEWEQAHIHFARLLIDMNPKEISSIKKDALIIFHCHHGSRSKRMAERWQEDGFSNIYNLTGGIDAWSLHIDQNVPTY